MKTVKLLAIAATTTLGLAACQEPGTAPPEPEVAARSVDAPGSLNGTYYLRASDCTAGDGSETRLVIDGNKFNFHESACTVADSETGASWTRVTLACTGEGQDFSRIVDLQNRPGQMRLTEGTTTLTYFKCDA
ncbi:MAG: hypothetical protein ACK5IP_10630 [Paracoccus sp. (in: a-proteobacteria)]